MPNLIIISLIAFFSLASNVLVADERDSIINGPHELSWAYYTGDYSRWYISQTNNGGLPSDVYSLTPIKSGRAGWATVGLYSADLDLNQNTISIQNNLDTNTSDVYYDVGWDELVEDASIHDDRQWIQGKNEPIKWYFFRVDSTGIWYIINTPGYGEGTIIKRFSSESDGVGGEKYLWLDTNTTDLDPIFYVENNGSLKLAWSDEGNQTPGEVRIENVPFLSQLSANCSPNYLCGYASTTMLTSFYHDVEPQTWFMQNMAEHVTGNSCPPSTSTSDDFEKGAREIGNVSSAYNDWLTWDELKQHLNEGVPVAVSVHNPSLGSKRCSFTWYGGHSVVVVGYSASRGEWLIHDPLCSTENSGAYRAIPSSVFRKAVKDVSGSDYWVDGLIVK